MKYVALLRGINVGGNNMIKMAELKVAFEKCGFKNVETYINSGNVIFESGKNSIEITQILEKNLSKTFNYNARLIIRSQNEIKDIVEKAPFVWKKKNDLRCYVAFVKDNINIEEVLPEIEARDGVDFINTGRNVLYLSTKLSGLTKSGFTKLIGKKIYQDITMRNFNTTQKIFALMD